MGRLDYHSEGLLLMTDDGAFANKITHPSHHVQKIYQVTVDKPYSQKLANELLSGVEIGPGRTAGQGCGRDVFQPGGRPRAN